MSKETKFKILYNYYKKNYTRLITEEKLILPENLEPKLNEIYHNTQDISQNNPAYLKLQQSDFADIKNFTNRITQLAKQKQNRRSRRTKKT